RPTPRSFGRRATITGGGSKGPLRFYTSLHPRSPHPSIPGRRPPPARAPAPGKFANSSSLSAHLPLCGLQGTQRVLFVHLPFSSSARVSVPPSTVRGRLGHRSSGPPAAGPSGSVP